ncbi:Xanthine dehydrogenase, iron-sulfur cluster and FAD-binding subunit A [Serratia plymuthica]|uniref:Xanthine dehydrogenase, iron-sulfur cluster and FAD-binding subunit A n=1 Tax=Serratia plymuthica TaxID=82996 RepID=A0A2X4V240_SERPL|nr:Xanthine dehydrogenase, iron-sulfur cluster and FAD-binding subunit A [Serratia plymuthica]
MIAIGQIEALKQVSWQGERLTIGAGAALSDLYPLLEKYHPAFGELLARFASQQIRNQGTLGAISPMLRRLVTAHPCCWRWMPC